MDYATTRKLVHQLIINHTHANAEIKSYISMEMSSTDTFHTDLFHVAASAHISKVNKYILQSYAQVTSLIREHFGDRNNIIFGIKIDAGVTIDDVSCITEEEILMALLKMH